jgi:hypothetical protein
VNASRLRDGVPAALGVVAVGAVVGWASANVLAVGFAATFVVWGLVALLVGASDPERAVLNGALFGFALGAAFAVATYTGADPVGHGLDDARAGGAGAAVCVVIGWIGAEVRSARLFTGKR